MRSVALFGLIWLSLVSLAFAWTKEDHEIFDLVEALENAEGKGTTFYSILDLSPSATSAEVGKAYRKKSLTMHPDKNPGVKNIEERFARLGVIAKILRNAEDRERYDFFYKNGVPKWRGTGYYYARFRPGLISVLIFLSLLTSGVQHGIAYINRKRDLDRIQRLVKNAKAIAYGPKGTPLEKGTKRKVRVPISGADPSEEPRNAGRMVDLMVDGPDVYIVGNHEPVILDESMAPVPQFLDTWVFSLVRSAYSALPLPKPKGEPSTSLPEEDMTDGFMSESSDTGKGAKKRKVAVKRK